MPLWTFKSAPISLFGWSFFVLNIAKNINNWLSTGASKTLHFPSFCHNGIQLSSFDCCAYFKAHFCAPRQSNPHCSKKEGFFNVDSLAYWKIETRLPNIEERGNCTGTHMHNCEKVREVSEAQGGLETGPRCYQDPFSVCLPLPLSESPSLPWQTRLPPSGFYFLLYPQKGHFDLMKLQRKTSLDWPESCSWLLPVGRGYDWQPYSGAKENPICGFPWRTEVWFHYRKPIF